MPGKKKKYNARFPPARIKKIMQSDEEVGKVAAAVPVIISRALELFVDSLLKKANDVATRRNARTLTPSHLKMCINSDSRFDFLKDLVSNVVDLQGDIDDTTPIHTPAVAVSSTSMESTFPFPRIEGDNHKFLQLNVAAAEAHDLSQNLRRPSSLPTSNDVPMDLRTGLNNGPKEITIPSTSTGSSTGPFIGTSAGTSTGKKRGRPRKVAPPSLDASLTSPKPKRKSRDSTTTSTSGAGSYQYYNNSSFPSASCDPSTFENARNVGRICDEDEDDLGISGDEEHSRKSSGNHGHYYPNGTSSGHHKKPMQHFVLSMKNGSNGGGGGEAGDHSSAIPSFVLLPQLGTTDKNCKVGCDDQEDEDSNALVVDEDYDC